MTQNATQTDEVVDYRIDLFEELKFTNREARLLAAAKNDDGTFVRPERVQEALDKGCKHVQAVRIFT
jgi:hypothetical protein